MVTIKLDARFWLVLFLATGVGGYALFSAFPGLSVVVPKESAVLAGWVQAIGAIASIVYAGRLVSRQFQHADLQHKKQWDREEGRRSRDAHATHLVLTRACALVATHACNALKSIEAKMTGADDRGRHPRSGIERLENIQQIILTLLAKDIPASAIAPLMDVSRQLAYAIAAVRALPVGFRPDPVDERTVSAGRRLRAVRSQRKVLNRLVSEAEGRVLACDGA
jgi:hypothetical protein